MSTQGTILIAQSNPAPSGGANGGAGGAGGLMSQAPFLIIMCVIMYLLMIRPQQKKQKEHRELISKIKAGDKVVTTSGIHGVVCGVEEANVMLEVADGVKIKIVRSAIGTVLNASADADEKKK